MSGTTPLPRPCALENIHSGRIIRAPSLIEFCRKARLWGNSRFHITQVLNGARPSIRGWYPLGFLGRQVKLADIWGNEYRLSLKTLIKRHGMYPSSVTGLLDGRKRVFRNLTAVDRPIDGYLKPRDYRVTGVTVTNGWRTIRAANLTQAARRAGICFTAFHPLAYGLKEEVSGYRLIRFDTAKRKALT